MNKNKNLGFTLAEVLIVIGIIGVVAALTLPNLNHATGDKETVTRVKKAYSTLSDAFDRAQVVYGNFDTWFKGLEGDYDKMYEVFGKRVTEFMKISKDCGIPNDSDTDCNVYSPIIEHSGYTVGLPDGMLVGFLGWKANSSDAAGYIVVDINGENKGKNEDGKDIFCFDIKDNQLYPGGGYGYSSNADNDELASNCLNSNYCTEWVVTVGNLDYLKVDDEGKCPNGVELSWTNNSCN